MSAETVMQAETAAHEHEGGHGGWKFYTLVGVILTVITAVEVAIFYVPALESVLVPTLLVLSAAKFVIVIMFYMHLKFDHNLFTFVFLAGLILAVLAVSALMVLAHMVPRMGAWA